MFPSSGAAQLDLLINARDGTTAFAHLVADEPNILLESIFVLEAVEESRWHVDQFLAPTPIRGVVDVRGCEGSNRFIAA